METPLHLEATRLPFRPKPSIGLTDTHGCQNGSQVCADGLHGFRYQRIYLDALTSDAPLTQPNGTVSISSVPLTYTGFLGTPDTFKGGYECSDSELTQYWYDSAYTNEMITDTVRPDAVDPRNSSNPSLDGNLVLFDGAKRDRDPYVGDIAVSALTDYFTHYIGEAPLNILAILLIIKDPTFGFRQRPSTTTACRSSTILFGGRQQAGTTNTSSDLLSKGLNGTESYGDYAFLGRDAELMYYNALYVFALQAGASIATTLDHSEDASAWTTRASTVSAAMNNDLWDSSVGAYIDSNNGTVRHTQDGNSIAVLAGVANSTYATSALNYLDQFALPYGNPFMDNDSLVPDGTDRVYAFLSYFDISAPFVAG